eukprot:6472868-Amphidinium_carterae.1
MHWRKVQNIYLRSAIVQAIRISECERSNMIMMIIVLKRGGISLALGVELKEKTHLVFTVERGGVAGLLGDPHIIRSLYIISHGEEA